MTSNNQILERTDTRVGRISAIDVVEDGSNGRVGRDSKKHYDRQDQTL